MAENELIDAAARHTTDVYRYSTQVYQKMLKRLMKAERRVLNDILELTEGMSAADRRNYLRDTFKGARLIALRDSINELAKEYRTIINEGIREDGHEFVAAEAAYASNLAGGVIAVESDFKVNSFQIYSAALAQPFNGKHLKKYVSQIEPYIKDRLNQSLRDGFVLGRTNHEMISDIRGTRKNNYKDGILQTSRHSAERLVRTFNVHLAARAHLETFKALGVKKYKWLSTLDGRTSKICGARDGLTYTIGLGPLPPAHPACRSNILPDFGEDYDGTRPFVRDFVPVSKIPKNERDKKIGSVKASTNYAKFLANSPASFQKEWLGPTRYKLYKEGGLKIERFVDLQGGEYNLDELKQKNAKIWADVFD